MLVVETIARIRRDHLVRGVPIKEIARDLRVSKNTVRKVVRGDETSFSYERKIQPMPKLGPWEPDHSSSHHGRLPLSHEHTGPSQSRQGRMLSVPSPYALEFSQIRNAMILMGWCPLRRAYGLNRRAYARSNNTRAAFVGVCA